MSVVTDDEAKISELFVRLNTSKPLAGAEIRNAMVGEVPRVIRDLVTHEFWTKTRFSKLRGQDKNAAAKLLLLEHMGTFVDTKKRQLDRLVAEVATSKPDEVMAPLIHEEVLENQPPDESVDESPVTDDDVAEAVIEAEESDVKHASRRVWQVLDRMTPLFIVSDPLLNQQAQVPVVYWLVRSLSGDLLRHVRPFLAHFEQARARNRSLPVGHQERDPFLTDFELMARTSNDQASIGGRYRIMHERFNEFVKSAKATTP
ncbi:hypothetical protein N825_11065 [Skermanella stibiiresistens SB22]|uniref:Uncharacterized protein n=2 Tax=Skermanella TaxID=204447 RepID=W9GYB9_9PROT|nr:hypothetical protein N825_11065 [Skermanella stibiiresistens SB22]